MDLAKTLVLGGRDVEELKNPEHGSLAVMAAKDRILDLVSEALDTCASMNVQDSIGRIVLSLITSYSLDSTGGYIRDWDLPKP